MSNGIVQVYYGEGHGKSTVAFGTAIHMAGSGKTATIIEFLKGKIEAEQEYLKRFEPELKCFSFAKSDKYFLELSPEEQQEEVMNQKNGFNYGKKVASTGACDLLVLDEILGLVDLQVISFEEFKQLIDSRPEEMSIICTGRVLDDRIRELADEIYNITPEK